MGLLDQLTGTMKETVASLVIAEAPSLITRALGRTDPGNLSAIVDQLREGGLQEQVRSWLGAGTNMPVTAEQIRSALGNNRAAHLAEQLGVPLDVAAQMLARHLPALIDQASPDGTIKTS